MNPKQREDDVIGTRYVWPRSWIIESCSNDAMQDWISSDVDIISTANFPDTI